MQEYLRKTGEFFFEWMVVGKSREEDDQERGKLTE